MGDHGVDHAHLVGFLRRIAAAQKENFPRPLLPDLPGEIGRAVARVVAGHVGIGLLENGVFFTCQRQITHHVQTVAAAHGPARHYGNDGFGHEANLPLHFQDIQSVEAIVALVARFVAEFLVATRAEGINAVLGRAFARK